MHVEQPRPASAIRPHESVPVRTVLPDVDAQPHATIHVPDVLSVVGGREVLVFRPWLWMATLMSYCWAKRSMRDSSLGSV